jgi:hypothetical protein
MFFFLDFSIVRTMESSKNPVILCVIHHRQNPSESTKLNDINVYKVGNDRGGSDHGLFQVIFPEIAWNGWRKPRKAFG